MSDAAPIPGLEPAPTRHAGLVAWVAEVAALTKPDRVHWCDGSDAEWERLTSELVKTARSSSSILKSGPGRGARRKPHLHLLGR